MNPIGVTVLEKGGNKSELIQLNGNPAYDIYRVESSWYGKQRFVKTSVKKAMESFDDLLVVHKSLSLENNLPSLYKICKKNGQIFMNAPAPQPAVQYVQNTETLEQHVAPNTPYVPEPEPEAEQSALDDKIDLNLEKYVEPTLTIIVNPDVSKHKLRQENFSKSENKAIFSFRAFVQSIYEEINKGNYEGASKELEERLKTHQEKFCNDLHTLLGNYTLFVSTAQQTDSAKKLAEVYNNFQPILKSASIVEKAEPIKVTIKQMLSDATNYWDGLEAERNSKLDDAKEFYAKIKDSKLNELALSRLQQKEAHGAKIEQFKMYINNAISDGSFSVEVALSYLPEKSPEEELVKSLETAIKAYAINKFDEAKKLLSSSIKEMPLDGLSKLLSEINKVSELEKQVDCGELASAKEKIEDLKPTASAITGGVLQKFEHSIKNLEQASSKIDNWTIDDYLVLADNLPGAFGATLKKIQNSLDKTCTDLSIGEYISSKNSLYQALQDAGAVNSLDGFKKTAESAIKQLKALADIEIALAEGKCDQAKTLIGKVSFPNLKPVYEERINKVADIDDAFKKGTPDVVASILCSYSGKKETAFFKDIDELLDLLQTKSTADFYRAQTIAQKRSWGATLQQFEQSTTSAILKVINGLVKDGKFEQAIDSRYIDGCSILVGNERTKALKQISVLESLQAIIEPCTENGEPLPSQDPEYIQKLAEKLDDKITELEEFCSQYNNKLAAQKKVASKLAIGTPSDSLLAANKEQVELAKKAHVALLDRIKKQLSEQKSKL